MRGFKVCTHVKGVELDTVSLKCGFLETDSSMLSINTYCLLDTLSTGGTGTAQLQSSALWGCCDRSEAFSRSGMEK